jgi:hypothetical protein
MKYSTIKWVLRSHIKTNVNSLWVWKKEENEFKCIYTSYSGNDRIYTAKQLLDKLENIEKKDKNTTQKTT